MQTYKTGTIWWLRPVHKLSLVRLNSALNYVSEHLRWQIGSEVTESQFIVHQRCLVKTRVW